MPRLENWSMTLDNNGNMYLAPELIKRKLHGNVYNHPNFNDGDPVITSSLKSFDLNTMKAETRNTVYELGKPSEDYLKWLEQNNMKLENFKDGVVNE